MKRFLLWRGSVNQENIYWSGSKRKRQGLRTNFRKNSKMHKHILYGEMYPILAGISLWKIWRYRCIWNEGIRLFRMKKLQQKTEIFSAIIRWKKEQGRSVLKRERYEYYIKKAGATQREILYRLLQYSLF